MDFSQFFNPAGWGSWAPGAQGAAPSGPTGDIGYGTGVGATGPIPAAAAAPQGGVGGQGWNNMLQKTAMGMLQPQAAKPQPLEMPKPVGPGQLPPPYGANAMMFPGMLNQGRMF